MKLLIIEDERELSASIVAYLSSENYVCEQAFTYAEALEKVGLYDYDCVLLDLMLPGGNGLDILREIRKRQNPVGVIIVSAKDSLDDKVRGLEIGADDYLTKPFDLDELAARVEVQLRDGARPDPSSGVLRFGSWELDPAARTFAAGGEPLRLTRTEFDILAALMRDPNRVYTKQALFELVRNEEALTEERTIATHVSNLRVKLRASGTDSYIQTVWGIGFKLQA